MNRARLLGSMIASFALALGCAGVKPMATPTGSGGSGQRDRPGRLRRQQHAPAPVQRDVHGLPGADRHRRCPGQRGGHLRHARLGRGRRPLPARAAGQHPVPQQLAAPALPLERRHGPVRAARARPQPGARHGRLHHDDDLHDGEAVLDAVRGAHARHADRGHRAQRRGERRQRSARRPDPFHDRARGRERQAGLLVDVGNDVLQRPAHGHRDRAERLRRRRRGRRRGAAADRRQHGAGRDADLRPGAQQARRQVHRLPHLDARWFVHRFQRLLPVGRGARVGHVARRHGAADQHPRRGRTQRDHAAVGRDHHLLARPLGQRRSHHGRAARHLRRRALRARIGQRHGPAARPGLVRPRERGRRRHQHGLGPEPARHRLELDLRARRPASTQRRPPGARTAPRCCSR